ncbi:hypothetical protein [Streptomyces ureilyticus]|uniref:Uncharacterized protein n=1 Tax=Streptomyces ureilyticus TaxID=1775131 RepID=A0ABX0DTN8_9ACTN|nr:hypothetical protein [Streptomyces ureilyticus]NGO45265.1 hypothetical protein [Streptomyces ureilyticus]
MGADWLSTSNCVGVSEGLHTGDIQVALGKAVLGLDLGVPGAPSGVLLVIFVSGIPGVVEVGGLVLAVLFQTKRFVVLGVVLVGGAFVVLALTALAVLLARFRLAAVDAAGGLRALLPVLLVALAFPLPLGGGLGLLPPGLALLLAAAGVLLALLVLLLLVLPPDSSCSFFSSFPSASWSSLFSCASFSRTDSCREFSSSFFFCSSLSCSCLFYLSESLAFSAFSAFSWCLLSCSRALRPSTDSRSPDSVPTPLPEPLEPFGPAALPLPLPPPALRSGVLSWSGASAGIGGRGRVSARPPCTMRVPQVYVPQEQIRHVPPTVPRYGVAPARDVSRACRPPRVRF